VLIQITPNAFDPWQLIQTFQASRKEMRGQYGATSLFIGTLRDFNAGRHITAMNLEYYPGMTEKQLESIVHEAMQQWSILDALVVHRVGDIFPDEPIVLVAVWSVHRGDAFDANRYIMEGLKSKAPFWKQERLTNNQTDWVKNNTTGYAEK